MRTLGPEEPLQIRIDAEAARSLMRSMVCRAVRDLVRYRDADRPRLRRIYNDAYEWVYADEEDCTNAEDQFMSFESVCGILGFDHERIRKRIPELTSADLSDLREVAG